MDYEIILGTSVKCRLCKKYIYKGFKGYRDRKGTFCSLEHFIKANPKLINPSPKKFKDPPPKSSVLSVLSENQINYKKSVLIGNTWKAVWKLRSSDLLGKHCTYCQSELGIGHLCPSHKNLKRLHFCDEKCAFNRQVDGMPLKYAVDKLLKIKGQI